VLGDGRLVVESIFEDMSGLLDLGRRSTVAVPLENAAEGAVAAELVVLALYLVGLAFPSSPEFRGGLTLMIGAMTAAGLFLWIRWAFPPFELRRDGQPTRWTGSRAIALDAAGVALGLGGVLLAVALD
jgi:uncharacterized RDD family membrane protein YckC